MTAPRRRPRRPSWRACPRWRLAIRPTRRFWRLSGGWRHGRRAARAARLVVDDMGALLCGALAGVGCAAAAAHDDARGAGPRRFAKNRAARLEPPPAGVVQAAPSRQGLRPAVRQLLDALAAGFDQMEREGRCLRAPGA